MVGVSGEDLTISTFSRPQKRIFTVKNFCHQEKLKVTSTKTHSSTILQEIVTFWKTESYCDVTLQAEGCELVCHKLMLAANSPYFHAMFTSGMEESKASHIPINEVSSAALKIILNFIYLGAFQVESKDLQDVISAANLLQLYELKDACCDIMQHYIDQVNCLGMVDFGLQYDSKSLLLSAMQIVRKRTSVVLKSSEFLQLSQHALLEIVKCDDLDLGEEGESLLLESIHRWYEHDAERRCAALPGILAHVRAGCITPETLSPWKDKLRQQGLKDAVSALEESQLKVELGRTPKKSLFVIGGYMQSRTGPVCPRHSGVEHYSPDTNTWKSDSELGFTPTCEFAFNVTGHLVISAITNNSKLVVLEYDIVCPSWKDITSKVSTEALDCLQEGFASFTKVGHTKSSAWVMAFCNKTNRLYIGCPAAVHVLQVTVDDCGDISMTKATSYPLVPSGDHADLIRQDYCLVTHKGHLYSLGGALQKSQTEVTCTDHVFLLDTAARSWNPRSSMKEKRALLAAASLGERVYALGGFADIRLKSVEYYDTDTDSWTLVQSMLKHRTHSTALVHNNMIYIFGGKSYADNYQCGGARKVIRSCEKYDPTTETWTAVKDMLTAKCLFAAAIL